MKNKALRRQAYQRGLWAERVARLWLGLKGYRCLKTRYRSPFGEIDLVCLKANTLIAVEVKARATRDEALLSLSPQQQQRIAKCLLAYQRCHASLHGCDLRFDFVLLAGFKMCHIKGAWFLTSMTGGSAL